MDKHSLFEGLKALEQEIVAHLDKMDEIRRGFLDLSEDRMHNRERLKALATTLHEGLIRLRDLYQQVIYKSALLAKTDGGD